MKKEKDAESVRVQTGVSTCTLCGCNVEETTHLSLYVIGSEGIETCLPCRIILTNLAKGIMESAGRVKMNAFKTMKKC